MKKKSDSQKSDDKLKTAELRKRVGNRVAAIRRGKGMTQQDLADASGMSPDMIARIESGASGASFLSLVNLAEALKVDVAELFTAGLTKSARHPALTNLSARLSKLTDDQLGWLSDIIEAALKPKP